MKIIECVPNFSEGRRNEVIEAIAKAASEVPGVALLNTESDTNHNRMVLTFVGEPDPVKEAALEASSVAIRLIDLTKHRGEHPRMGAVDVVPFVPIRDISMSECIELANSFASEYSRRFGVPVFLYEAAARRPERRNLANVREGQFEGLKDLIGRDASKEPDYGPRAIHPTAGATAVGARKILIAYNVNLGTTDVSIAKKIAHRVRERDGGLPSVKALGFELNDKNMVQVSMNLTDYEVTSIHQAFEAVSKYAGELSVRVVESEIVGLVPLSAVSGAATNSLKLSGFDESQIIENRLLGLITRTNKESDFDFSNMTLHEFAAAVASKDPVPGGGSVSAYCGTLAASLVAMVCNLTVGKKGYESVGERVLKMSKEVSGYAQELQELARMDAKAYSKVSSAYSLPKDTEEARQFRDKAIVLALKEASEVPAKSIELCAQVLKLASEAKEIGNKKALSDSETAIELSKAAMRGAWSNVRINLESLKGEKDYSNRILMKLEPFLKAMA